MILQAKQPFDFKKSLAFASEFTPAAGEQRVDESVLRKAFEIDGICVLASMQGDGNDVHLHLYADADLTPAQRAKAKDRVAFYLSLDDDLQPFYASAEGDRAFAPLLERGHGFHQVKFGTPFESAMWAVLTQRMAVRLARRVKDRIVERFGTSIERGGTTYRAFPSPLRLFGVGDSDLLSCGVLARKLPYLRAVVEAFCDVDESWLRAAPLEEVEAWLREINGIGEWSAQFILSRGLGRMESLGVAEPLLEAARAVYGRVDKTRMRRLGEQYGDARGYWLFYLKAVPAISA
jgi:DNA-3-methyladenine glycosylase II